MYVNFGGVVMVIVIFVAGMALGSYMTERKHRKAVSE